MRKQLFWFAVSGSLAFLIDAGIVQSLVTGLNANPFVARVPSVACAMLFTWLFNRTVTFAKKRPEGQGLPEELMRYVGTQSMGIAVNYATYSLCLWLLPMTRTWPFLAVAAGSLAGFLVNFMAAKKWVFER